MIFSFYFLVLTVIEPVWRLRMPIILEATIYIMTITTVTTRQSIITASRKKSSDFMSVFIPPIMLLLLLLTSNSHNLKHEEPIVVSK